MPAPFACLRRVQTAPKRAIFALIIQCHRSNPSDDRMPAFYINKSSALVCLFVPTRPIISSGATRMRAKRASESCNEYIKWLCGVWLLIKSCTSCTYSMRSLIRFFSSKPCTFYCQIWEHFEMFRKFRTCVFFATKIYLILLLKTSSEPSYYRCKIYMILLVAKRHIAI